MHGRGRRLAGTIVLGFAWLIAAAFVALAGAGLVVSADHLPGDSTRPERTWAQDVPFQARIRGLGPRYDALSGNVGTLGDTARNALVDLVAGRGDLLAADLAQGDRLLPSIDAQVTSLDGTLDAVAASTWTGRLGDQSEAMLAAARAALQTTGPLSAQWHALADGALPAILLTGVLQRHDDLVFAAIQQAHAEKYAAAVTTLAEAGAQLDQARQTRDALEARADVSTLSTYIDRMSAYDQALTALYSNLRERDGKMTAAGERLVAKVSAAQQLLPPDTRALVVIMADIAQAGLNQAAIAIEQARGDLGDAVAALHLAS
ncbi:MAG TPA: hypothetical protein VN800_06755 [Candidatus Acidoferrales bacterium]|nr:hypothetical protein [Candidatus Acidoferrales bacterium]